VLVLQLARERSVADVKRLMLPPASLPDALARVRSQLGADDPDVVMDATVISLRDPLTSCRIVTPVRFAEVPGLACFDLDAFLSNLPRTRKWQCPHRCDIHAYDENYNKTQIPRFHSACKLPAHLVAWASMW
jgi:E3 SUMO-protein ligase PIAS1